MDIRSPQSNFASIDIGSHTIRLLIAFENEKGELRPLRVERRITRLAANFQEDGLLKDASMRESICALQEYAELLKLYEASDVACGATGVVRRAGNGSRFLQMAEEATGVRGAIIPEDREAFLSAKGVLSVLPSRGEHVLTFDLGGGSTEFLLLKTGRSDPLLSESAFIGAATVTERRLRGDPVEESSMVRAMEAIREELAPILLKIRRLLHEDGVDPSSLLTAGTAGTVTTLAAMRLKMEVYEPFRVNGLPLDSKWLTETIDLLARLPIGARRTLPGLEAGREDIILGGALIVREVLRGLGAERMTATDAGFLEGLLLDLIERKHGLPGGLSTALTWRLEKG